MTVKRGLALGIALFFLVSFASSALATEIFVKADAENALGVGGYYDDGRWNVGFYSNLYQLYNGEPLAYTPSSTGFFSQQMVWNVSYFVSFEKEWQTSPTPTSIDFYGIAVEYLFLRGLNQDGTLRFSDVNWTATIIKDNQGTVCWSEHLEGNEIHDFIAQWKDKNGGIADDAFVVVELDGVTIPLTWWSDMYGNYNCYGSAEGSFQIVLTQSGYVVPLPSTMLLLGSGLLGLVGWRRFMKG